MKKRLSALPVIVSFLLFSSPLSVCLSFTDATSAGITAKKQPSTAPAHDPAMPALLGQVRLDLSTVLQALFYRLQGREMHAPEVVAFDPSVSDLRRDVETEIDLSGFVLQRISIRRDEEVGNDPLHRRIEAVYKIADSIGRQMFTVIAADYIISEKAVLIRQAVAIPYYPDGADIRFLILPANKLPALKLLKGLSFEELLSLVAENALSRKELERLKPGQPGRFKLAAFNMIKAEPGKSLNIYTSKDDVSGSIRIKDSLSLNKNGWTAALVDGEFMFNTAPGFWFYVGMSDAKESGKTRLLERFYSRIKQ
ncbi:MAG TPA: hypothetical protein PLT63_01150 [Syntrophales bacterium]|nr:hypothetical protein [Syntrophales bacterium]HPL66173.1 hypothetical protein [Smithellaceae bacterium]